MLLPDLDWLVGRLGSNSVFMQHGDIVPYRTHLGLAEIYKLQQQLPLTELIPCEPFDNRPVGTVHGMVALDKLVTDLSNRYLTVHRQTV